MFSDLVWCIAVALIWGITNPFIKKGTEGVEKVQAPGFIQRITKEVLFFICNWKYTLPWILNQSGSILYYWTLSTSKLSLVVPVTNALTLAITVVAGRLLGESAGGPLLYLGVGLVFAGVTLCSR